MYSQFYKKALRFRLVIIVIAILASITSAAVGLPLITRHLVGRQEKQQLPQGKSMAQDNASQEELAKKLNAEEKAALNKPEDTGTRIKTYGRLTRARLKNARDLLDQQKYAAAAEQLEVYTALVNDAGRFLSASVPLRDRANKTLEMELREQIRGLEGVRRDMTALRMETVEAALEAAHRVRLQALNAMLGNGKILAPGKTPTPEPSPRIKF